VGRKIVFRDDKHGSKWEEGAVDKINPGGYLFISR
jgi:hypothetical protein